jgi:hypothetical protein
MSTCLELTYDEIDILSDLVSRALVRQGIAQHYNGREKVVYSLSDKIAVAKGPDPDWEFLAAAPF